MGLDFSGFDDRPPLGDILEIPKRVQSVYSLTQHVWDGDGEEERIESKKHNKVRLDTLDEFFIDPVRSYLNRILEKIADGEGQGFWLQAEFGVGKSHLMASTAVMAVGGPKAWHRVKEREDKDRDPKGPGARLDSLWRTRIEKLKIFPIVFSLEGCGGGHEKKLEDFILDDAQKTFALREGKPLAVYPEEHLAGLYLKDHKKTFDTDLRTFLADKRLTRGLPEYEHDELIAALKDPDAQRDAGRVLMAFYRHKNLHPNIPTERGERLGRAIRDILEAGYNGVFIAIDEMSEYLKRDVLHQSDNEDCLLVLTSTLAKAQGLPVWTIVAAQSEHTNPKKIIGPDRLRLELLEHKEERFRDIVVQRIRKITDRKAVDLYFAGYKNLIPWVKESDKADFEASFPFPPDAVKILRSISMKLTGTRSTIAFLHRALQMAIEAKEKELIPLWRVMDDLMSYNETPSANSSGAVSIQATFRAEVAALSAAQNTMKRITEGQLARPQNRSRAERILNTLFLYRIASVDGGLTPAQILDAVCDPKPKEEELEAQLGHYHTILEEMTSKLRNQVRKRQERYEFVPKESSAYDDLVNAAADKLKNDPQKLWQMIDRLMMHDDPNNPLQGFVSSDEDWRRVALSIDRWHGQERTGRVTAADLTKPLTHHVEVEQTDEDDFLVVISRRDMTEKAVDSFLKKKDGSADPRIVVWAPALLKDDEKATLASVLAHLLVADDNRGSSKIENEARKEFGSTSSRAYTVLREVYGRGIAKTCRTSVSIPAQGGFDSKMAQMATEALDTCYKAREIDFGNRKFDAQGAVKLANGLIKRGEAVGQGDQLWSAVENFAGPLGLVRPDAPTRLDPDLSKFYKEIRKKIEEHRSTGIPVETVYNWFTGYEPKDGKESWGLMRRMVDMYLLTMARQGIVRISLKKKGEWIDRNNITDFDFKPEHLRNLERIEMPKPLDDWGVFCPYLEELLSRPPGSLGPVPIGSLGPLCDHAKAEEALRLLYDGRWIRAEELQYHDRDLKSLFSTLARQNENPFDDLLLYWLDFAEEQLPLQFDDREVFNLLRRSVMKVAGVTVADDLTPEHLSKFKVFFRRLADLKESFKKTSLVLIRAAKLSSAQLPEGTQFKEIDKAQSDVRKELQKAQDLVLKPDLVNTRLQPRLSGLENVYVPAYLGALTKLNEVQNELHELEQAINGGQEVEALAEFGVELTEAASQVQACKQELSKISVPLRNDPEDRDAAESDVKRDGTVKDRTQQDLTFKRIVSEIGRREEIKKAITGCGHRALAGFAAFLLSARVVEKLRGIQTPVDGVKEILKAKSERDAGQALLAIPAKERKAFAKQVKAAIGGKKAKTVKLSDFEPKNSVVFEASDIESVVTEFREYLNGEWENGSYIKIEK